jgi:hypothetical protein
MSQSFDRVIMSYFQSFQFGPEIDSVTLGVLAVFALMGAWIVREKLEAAALGILSYPLHLGFAVLVYHTVQFTGTLNPKQLEEWFLWLFGATFIGIFLALMTIWLLMTIKAAISETLLARHRPTLPSQYQ